MFLERGANRARGTAPRALSGRSFESECSKKGLFGRQSIRQTVRARGQPTALAQPRRHLLPPLKSARDRRGGYQIPRWLTGLACVRRSWAVLCCEWRQLIASPEPLQPAPSAVC